MTEEMKMTAKIIAVINRKGGCGKTTVSMMLGGALGKKKKKVLIADGNQDQGSSIRWASVANEETPFPADVVEMGDSENQIHNELKKNIYDYDFIIVDCPPTAKSVIGESVLLVADLAIVPIEPNPLDMWGTVGIKKLIKEMQGKNEALQARLLINKCSPNTRLTKNVLEILPDFEMECLKTKLHKRTAFAEAPAIGGIVHDLGYKAKEAIKELDQLTAEVLKILK